MQITAKLHQVMPPETIQGKNGPIKKQNIIVETEGQYPKKVCFLIWGDKAEERLLQPGANLTIDFDLESREYNGRWYTDVKAWRVAEAGASAGGNAGGNAAGNATTYNDGQAPPPADNDDDGLPF